MSIPARDKLMAKLTNPAYRHGYVASHIHIGIRFQLRHIREARGWTKAELAAKAKMTPAAVARLEDPNAPPVTLANLLKIAEALDVALLVRFVPFSRLVAEYADCSPEALVVPSFENEGRSL